MDTGTIKNRWEKLEEYLDKISSHLVTRSTPYFEQVFDLPPKVIIYWVKNYEGFDGVRRINNKRINFEDYADEKEENIKEVDNDTQNLAQLNSKINELLVKMSKGDKGIDRQQTNKTMYDENSKIKEASPKKKSVKRRWYKGK